MYIICLVALVHCSKKFHRYLIKSYDNRNALMKMSMNFNVRVTEESLNAPVLSDSVVAEVEEVQKIFAKIKMHGMYLCKSDESSNVMGLSIYSEDDCLWKVDPISKDGGVMLKIGGNFLVKTGEMDNRESSPGYKLRLVPFATADNGGWVMEKYRQYRNEGTDKDDVYSSSSDSDDSDSEAEQPPKKTSVIIGVEKKLRPDEKKKYHLK